MVSTPQSQSRVRGRAGRALALAALGAYEAVVLLATELPTMFVTLTVRTADAATAYQDYRFECADGAAGWNLCSVELWSDADCSETI